MTRKIKGIAVAAAALLLVFLAAPAALAVDTYDVAKLYLKLDVPPTLRVVDAGSGSDTYFTAISTDSSFEININMTIDDESKSVFNYKYLTEQKLAALADAKSGEPGVTKSAFREQEKAVFVTYVQTNTINAETVINGQRIRIV